VGLALRPGPPGAGDVQRPHVALQMPTGEMSGHHGPEQGPDGSLHDGLRMDLLADGLINDVLINDVLINDGLINVAPMLRFSPNLHADMNVVERRAVRIAECPAG
jgi:hypothetical protein